MLQDRADKICEMATVMNKSIQIDEQNMVRQQEAMARLVAENKVIFLLPEITLHFEQECDFCAVLCNFSLCQKSLSLIDRRLAQKPRGEP